MFNNRYLPYDPWQPNPTSYDICKNKEIDQKMPV